MTRRLKGILLLLATWAIAVGIPPDGQPATAGAPRQHGDPKPRLVPLSQVAGMPAEEALLEDNLDLGYLALYDDARPPPVARLMPNTRIEAAAARPVSAVFTTIGRAQRSTDVTSP